MRNYFVDCSRSPGTLLRHCEFDVHGAGSRRNDAKAGKSHRRDPQGDVRRVYHCVRIVRPL
jgi:hypothetical protein